VRVDAQQARPHHGIQGRFSHTLFIEERLDAGHLVGLYVDEKLIGCLGRQALAPVVEQVVAHGGQ
jgi:hypothetical protein